MKRLAFVFALIFILAGTAHAQKGKDGSTAKLHQSLVGLHEEHTLHKSLRSAVPFKSADSLIKVIDDRVLIDAIASGDAEALKAQLESLGMQGAVSYGRIVSGQLPISAIPAAAELIDLRFAKAAVAMTNAGLVTSQGDVAMKADEARSFFGIDGTGVKVGVLSDSFNCLGGAVGDVANGDLSPVTVLQEEPGCSSGSDEGRAMLQIVHDVAPGASLSFATAFTGQAGFANNIQALATDGAKVIVDDVFYFAEPMFQDGIIAQAVDNVVASGVAYFSAAGNSGRKSYDHAFVPGPFFPAGSFGSPNFFGGTAHNFGGGDVFQRVTVGPFTSFGVSLQWDSPFFSAGGAGTQNDVDVYILNANRTAVLLSFTTDNLVSGDPVEFGTIVYSGAVPIDVNVMIVNFAGPNPGRIKYVIFQSPKVTIKEFATKSGTIIGHANAAGAQAVGAARYSKTPEFGVKPPRLESFSSGGTTPILFDTDGLPLATPDLRANKPEIVAPDGADTTFFGFDSDGSGFPNFFGTSAAAPHAAAVAALLLENDGTMTPAEIYAALQNTAINMGVAGFDNNTGFGLIQADNAVAGSTLTRGALSLPMTEVGLPYSASLATGGVPPYTFTLVTGTFPAGLTPDVNNGNLTGIPTTPAVLGKSFTVRISDQLGDSVKGTFKIVIKKPVMITTISLPTGTQGQSYSKTLAASGGKKPFTWTLVGGSLPTNFNLSPEGVISGTTMDVGTFTPEFKVVDDLGGEDQKVLNLTIN